MLARRWLAPLVLASLVFSAGGCRGRRPPPAEPAPPRVADEDLEDEEGDEEESTETPARVSPRRPGPRRANTINGHPRGPKAEEFNRVVQSAYPGIHQCFLARLDVLKDRSPGIQVRIVVGNRGRVVRAEVVGGVADRQVRSCVLSVLKGLQFPAFEGPAVSQVVPFALVRAGGGPQAPRRPRR